MNPHDPIGGAVLALDASGEPASAALWLDGTQALLRVAGRGERAGTVLHSLIASLLEALEGEGGRLSAVVAVRGPGSFTGLRVALAAAGGLSLALGIPGLGVGTSAALAWASGHSGVVATLIDGGRGRLFAALHRRSGAGLESLAPVVDLAPEAVLGWLAAAQPGATLLWGGDPVDGELKAAGVERFSGPLAGAAAELAALGLARDPLTALYVRAPAIRPNRS